MKLINLVDDIIADAGKLEELCRKESLDLEADAIMVYTTEPLSIESTIKLAVPENSSQDKIEAAGTAYKAFLPAEEIIELSYAFSSTGKHKSNKEIAEKLITFRANKTDTSLLEE
ncbi:hypothetical protein ACI6Q2_11390 [Chitinophagaceae bacterium LWZ2-11]